jgi:hypothetical protein
VKRLNWYGIFQKVAFYWQYLWLVDPWQDFSGEIAFICGEKKPRPVNGVVNRMLPTESIAASGHV